MRSKLNSNRVKKTMSNGKKVNTELHIARSAKKDEFYTQLSDIEKELRYYRKQLRNKIIFCNCDDPFESNFFKYFADNFSALGIKKLIATSYSGSPITGTQLSLFDIEGLRRRKAHKTAYVAEINAVPDMDGDGVAGPRDVRLLLEHNENVVRPLKDGGDFRSEECIELLKQADIVITNPPFSLFREYLSQLVAHRKKFLIIGNINAVTYKECFPLIRSNKMWLGASIHSGDREFRVPDHYPLNAAGFRVDNGGNKFIRVKGVRWFTNLDYKGRHEEIPLYKKYSKKEYPSFDNYEAININKTLEIPMDHKGAMGVPITFLDKYSPEQFEIISANDIRVNQSTPFKEHGLIKDKDGAIKGKPTYVRIVIRARN